MHCFIIQILTQVSLYNKEITSLDGSALQDETTLVWYSHNKEKCLVLSSVSRIIPGQRTVSRNTTLQLPVYHRVRWFLSFFLTVKLDGYFAAMQSQLKFLMTEKYYGIGSQTFQMDINEFIFFCQAVFRRFLHPEKDYLSFSLIYKKGQRSLDLVRCNVLFSFF